MIGKIAWEALSSPGKGQKEDNPYKGASWRTLLQGTGLGPTENLPSESVCLSPGPSTID